MADSLLLSGNPSVLRDSLTGLSKRQQLIAGNIANMETAGYRAKDVQFETALQQEMGKGPSLRMLTTAAMHMDGTGGPEAKFASVERGNPFEADGTGVDVDYEMARLAETTIRFDAVTQMMASKISILRSAITEGRR